MKKTVSVLLAVVLMFSLSVSAFAANLTPAADKEIVKAGETVTVTLSLNEDIANAISIAYKLYFNADLFDVTSSKSTVDGGTVTMSTVKTNATGSYVNLSTMDTTSEGQLLKAGGFAQVTFTAKAEATPGQASFTAEFESFMDTTFKKITTGYGAGPAVTVTVTRDYSVTLPEGFTGAATVAHGADYTFTAEQLDPNYDYSFENSTMGSEKNVTVVKNEDGSFTVKNVTGALIIVPNKTGKQYNVTYTYETDCTEYGGDSYFDFGNLNEDKATYGENFKFVIMNMDEDAYTYSFEITIG